MKHLSLFSGIGGFDLAAEWAGFENIGQVEKDEFCLKVLNKNFPNVPKFTEVKDFPPKDFAGRPDVISGGFPCQPFSSAGKRKGQTDDRYLWPEMLRVIQSLKPAWVVAENVRGLLSIQSGMVFEQVCADLENAGYEVQAFIIPACAKGAPHRRDRVWFIAYANHNGNAEGGDSYRTGESGEATLSSPDERREGSTIPPRRCGKLGYILRPDSNTNSYRLQGRSAKTKKREYKISQKQFKGFSNFNDWKNLPQPTILGGHDGIPNRMDRIKSIGNAIVPQVAFEIFKNLK